MLLACSTHLLTSLLYFVPVAGFVGWLGVVTLKDRRKERLERAASAELVRH